MNTKKLYRWEFSLLAVIIYTAFFMIPVIMGFYYAFTNWGRIGLGQEVCSWIGFENFREIFSNPQLLAIIGRTIFFGIITTIGKNILGFLLALFLFAGLKTKNVVRAIFFLPAMLSPLIIGLIFGSIFMKTGLLNQILDTLGLDALMKNWLTTKSTAFATVSIVEIWRQMGFNMVIYLSGLMLIDTSYYEAASIDGANRLQKLFFITLPRMLPSITINLILNLSQGLKAFDIIYVLTNGGPDSSTELINTKAYALYGAGFYGKSAAYGVIMFIITAFFGFLSMVVTKDKNED